MINQFLKTLQEIAEAHNQYGYIDFMRDRIIYYIDRFMAASNQKEIECLILRMEQECQGIYNNVLQAVENEKRRKEEAAQELKAAHMKQTGCGPICD